MSYMDQGLFTVYVRILLMSHRFMTSRVGVHIGSWRMLEETP